MIALDSGDKIKGDASTDAVVDCTLHGTDANALKQLAASQLSDTPASDLYTADSVDALTSIILVNTHSSAVTVNLFHTPSAGSDYRIIPKNLVLGVGYSLHTDGKTVTVTDLTGGIVTTSIALSDASPNTIEPDDSASAGTGTAASRADHEHAIAGAAPNALLEVKAQAEGSSTSFARADHDHAIVHDITDNSLVTVDGPTAGAPASGEYSRWTANGIEGRSKAEQLSDLNVADGADVTGSSTPQAHEGSHVSGGSDDIDSALAPIAIALTTRGDIVYQDASGLQRLAKGTDGHVLTMGADEPAWAEAGGVAGYSFLTVKGFQFNPATGTFSTDPFDINDNNTGTLGEANGIGQYAEVIPTAALHITQFRHYGTTSNAGNGTWKIEYMNVGGSWVDWVTGIATRAVASWSNWDSTGGDVVVLAIRLTATSMDSEFNKNHMPELEVKY